MATITERLNKRDPLLRSLLDKYKGEKLAAIRVSFGYSITTVDSADYGDYEDVGSCDLNGECKISSRVENGNSEDLPEYQVPAIISLWDLETLIDDTEYLEKLTHLEYDYSNYTLVELLKAFLKLGSDLESSNSPIGDHQCWFTVTDQNPKGKDVLSVNYTLHIDGLEPTDYQVIYDLLKTL